MENSKNKAIESTEDSAKETVDVELNDSQLDAVSGGVVDGPDGGGCTGGGFPWDKKPRSTVFKLQD